MLRKSSLKSGSSSWVFLVDHGYPTLHSQVSLIFITSLWLRLILVCAPDISSYYYFKEANSTTNAMSFQIVKSFAFHLNSFLCSKSMSALKSKEIKSANQGWGKQESTRSFLPHISSFVFAGLKLKCASLWVSYLTYSHSQLIPQSALGSLSKLFINIFLFMSILVLKHWYEEPYIFLPKSTFICCLSWNYKYYTTQGFFQK